MKKIVPVIPAAEAASGACDGAEAFALMVLGDSMAPEFEAGEIVVIEPAGVAGEGSYVLAHVNDEWIFRQLLGRAGGWRLAPLNPAFAAIDIDDLTPVRGVIIQKSKPGRRKASKRYVE